MLSATACPSNRIPWDIIIGKINAEEAEEDMSILVRETGTSPVYVFDGSTFKHIPGGKFAEVVYGSGWQAQVKNISDKDDPRHPNGNANLPKFYPRG